MASTIAIDQHLLMMWEVEELAKKRTLGVFIEDISLKLLNFEEKDQAKLIHTIDSHKNLLRNLISKVSLLRGSQVLIEGFRAPFPFGLTAIYAAFADTCNFEKREIKKEVVFDQARSLSNVHLPFLCEKTVRAFSGIITALELDDFSKVYLDLFGNKVSSEMNAMIEIFRDQILPLCSKKQKTKELVEKSICSMEDLSAFQERILDLGVEARAQAILEIGLGKMEKAKEAVNHLFLDF